MLQVCDERGDEKASDVRIRVQGASSDLYAADGRYHDKCRKSFMNPKQIKAARNENQRDQHKAFLSVCETIRSNRDKIWNSVELHQYYVGKGGKDMKRSRLTEKVGETLKDEVIVLSSPGIANIIMFKSKASSTFHVDEIGEEIGINLQTVAKSISNEIKTNKNVRAYYEPLTYEAMMEEVSPTLLSLMALISPGLDNTLPAAMAGNIIASCFKKANPSSDLSGNIC